MDESFLCHQYNPSNKVLNMTSTLLSYKEWDMSRKNCLALNVEKYEKLIPFKWTIVCIEQLFAVLETNYHFLSVKHHAADILFGTVCCSYNSTHCNSLRVRDDDSKAATDDSGKYVWVASYISCTKCHQLHITGTVQRNYLER